MGFRSIVDEMMNAGNQSIVIGIQEGTRTEVQTKRGRKQRAGISIARYAAENEFGAPGVPERSFMRSTFDQKIQVINQLINAQLGLVIDQKIPLRIAYARIGLGVQSLIQQKIREIRSPPNSPETIARKGSSKPLIDFGQMLNSVRYAFRKGNPS